MTTQNNIFNNSSSIGNDSCGIMARDQQNNNIGSYHTTNYFLADCGTTKPVNFATKQPGILGLPTILWKTPLITSSLVDSLFQIQKKRMSYMKFWRLSKY